MKRSGGPMFAAAFLPFLVVGCSPASLADEGAALAASMSALSPSALNLYSCRTCHEEQPGDASERLLPGAPLAGATLRTSFWGGQESDLLAALNACRGAFMGASSPLGAGSPEAAALYAYLLSLEPGSSEPVAFTVQRTIIDLPSGSAEAGLDLYDAACATCHGAPHTGAGRLSTAVPVLPEESVAQHRELGYSDRLIRLVFIEKVRHGPFLGYGGSMPPFSVETLTDPDLADVLEALGVTGDGL